MPKFEGLPFPLSSGLQPQVSGGPIRVPPLSPAKAAEYASLFEKSGAHNGILSGNDPQKLSYVCFFLLLTGSPLGDNAKQIFGKAKLPNEVLGRIWNLADTEQRGALGVTEFVIAMHLLASFKTGTLKALPTTLPAGLYEAAARRGAVPPQPGRPRPDESVAPISRQFSGAGPQRNQSPMVRPPYPPPPQSGHHTGSDWLISPQEKADYDVHYNKIDTASRGFITGEQAVGFFSDSGLPEDILAMIWDLADIDSDGQLTRDEFAVAMYLIRQQRLPGVMPPTSLPPSLIPPSMRNQAKRSLPPVAPPRDHAQYTTQPPKSAAEDLFGLDAFSAPPPAQTQQATGGSSTFNRTFDADPFSSKTASPTSPQAFQPSPRNPASTFKPFMPTSSFGQTLASHSTGASGNSVSHSRGNHASAMDDLLGDHDPELNKKLTQETTELANMSNQIGTLRTQMQEVQNKKATTESDLHSASTQKRDLELRLSQFKSQYEQELKSVRTLEERLIASRNETRKLQEELTHVEGEYHNLQNQHRQIASAFDSDQRENATLKERIRQVNAEIGQLRPQLEKMKSDARQQKGLVAINKKQLATNEGEREKIKADMNELTKSAQENFRHPAQDHTSGVASPAASTTSHNNNPFFRMSPPLTNDNTMSPSGFSREASTSHQKDFDNVFGPSFTSPQTTLPPTSFRSESQSQMPGFSAPSGHSVRSSEPDVPTPSTSPPLSSYQESPRTGEPPAPPESRQFASSFLPLRDGLPRSDSFSSSVKVSAPASRYGPAGNETPTIAKSSPSATPVPDKKTGERSELPRIDSNAFGSNIFDRNLSASPVASTGSDARRSNSKSEERKDTFTMFGQPSLSHDIPGAFPRDTGSPVQQLPTGDSTASDRNKAANRPIDVSRSRTDPFSAPRDQPRGASSAKVDFDAAFAGFGSGRPFQDSTSETNTSVKSASKFNKEFPPIEDLAHDDDSDSTSEQGFADNFTSASPQQHRDSVGQSKQPQRSTTGAAAADGATDEYFKAHTTPAPVEPSATGLPPANAQKSPPTYEQSMGGPSRSGTRDANQFPPEFGGLLPSRQDPTSSLPVGQAPEKPFSGSSTGGQGGSLFGRPSSANPMSSGPTGFSASPPPADTPSSTVPSDAYHSALSFSTAETNKGLSPPANVAQTSKPSFNDEFDAGFDDLAEAKEADDKTDDDFMVNSQQRDGFDEFNPVFDSPAASKSNTMASQQTPTGKGGHGEDSFSDFEHLSQSFGQSKVQQQPSTATSQDWDAIFSNLESSQTEKSVRDDDADAEPTASGSSSKQTQLPQLGRALSAGTEHDDPILKKLTGMGYPRTEALGALEKFDYDINKVG